MIFGHHFYFQDEPSLQKEYLRCFSKTNDRYDAERAEVLLYGSHTLLDTFSFETEWIKLSGQEGRYLGTSPISQSQKESSWALEVKDVLTLAWDAKEEKIRYIRGRNFTPQRLRFWIYHTFFPLVLELRRKYRILHVGAVEVEGRPILFSAFSFGGKSTMTDYFIQQGHTLLSDDSLAIDVKRGVYYAIPSYPFHRPYRELETLGHFAENFSTEPKPVHAVYLLDKGSSDIEINIVELKGIEKFKAFHYSTFVDFNFMRQERFAFVSEMAKHVPVYKIKVPWDLERLDEVYERIVLSVK